MNTTAPNKIKKAPINQELVMLQALKARAGT
jgi:hypothetical protein